MEFSKEQLEVMNELVSFIKFKNLIIETKQDMDKAFSLFLQSNCTNYYLESDEFDKKQFIKSIN